MSRTTQTTRSLLDDLIAAAEKVRLKAYAPYSKYLVGAAVQGDNGKIYAAANIENASYGLCICAERNAVSAAVLDGVRKIIACAVVTGSDPPASPCGMCRQTLAEFAPASLSKMSVALVNNKGARVDTDLGALLPQAFRPGNLR